MFAWQALLGEDTGMRVAKPLRGCWTSGVAWQCEVGPCEAMPGTGSRCKVDGANKLTNGPVRRSP